jgi:micrococcal nuclease
MADNTKLTNRLFFLLWRGKYRDFVIFGVLFLALLVFQSWTEKSAVPAASLQSNSLSEVTVPVERVVDGDTFAYIKNGKEIKVRLTGTDTPETIDPRQPVQCFGKEASELTKKLIEGKSVRLVRDTEGDSVDLYGRELRYVYLPDGTLLNAFLIENGYAHATPEYSFTRKEDFLNLENEARIAQRGLWNPQTCN